MNTKRALDRIQTIINCLEMEPDSTLSLAGKKLCLTQAKLLKNYLNDTVEPRKPISHHNLIPDRDYMDEALDAFQRENDMERGDMGILTDYTGPDPLVGRRH